jgi:hypothetical protein
MNSYLQVNYCKSKLKLTKKNRNTAFFDLIIILKICSQFY